MNMLNKLFCILAVVIFSFSLIAVRNAQPPPIPLLGNVDTRQSFEFDGYYVISGTPPRGFENLAAVPQQIGGSTKSANGHISTRAGTTFKFTAISVSRAKITFTTRSVRGISYKFDGKFLTDKPTRGGDQVVLEGTL